MKSRLEPFGAWISVAPQSQSSGGSALGALVAVDAARAEAMGLYSPLWGKNPESHPRSVTTAPIELHVSVGERCPMGCVGCYQDAKPDGAEVPFEQLVLTLEKAAQAGVFSVAFGGGEPLLRGDLAKLGEVTRSFGMIPVVTTSGLTMSEVKAQALRVFAQVNVSHDGVLGGYDAVRGVELAHVAERAITMLVAAGIRVGVNLVLTRHNFAFVAETAKHVQALGAQEIQLLRYKPKGRATLAYLEHRLSEQQVAGLPTLMGHLVSLGLTTRLDCSLVPLLRDHFAKDPQDSRRSE